MGQDNATRRWDTDTIGHGVANGTAFAAGVQQFLAALHQERWVAEDPDVHLLPHLRRICEADGSPWQIGTTTFADGVYEVTLAWLRQDGNLARLRADIFLLVGALAEGSTYVQQKVTHDRISYEVITGLLDGDTPFRGHGHLIRFHVERSAARTLLTRMHHSDTNDETTLT